MKKTIFTGAGVAIVTPMNPDESINFEELGRLIDHQIENGTDAIVICGTTGESSTMTDQEHVDCIAYAVERTAGRVPVIAGAGSNHTSYAVWMSQEAKKAGADALLHVTPYYNKTSQAGLIRHFNTIADATDLPVILYNVPSRTGVNIAPATYRELAKHPNIVAVKEACGNISRSRRPCSCAATSLTSIPATTTRLSRCSRWAARASSRFSPTWRRVRPMKSASFSLTARSLRAASSSCSCCR